MNKTIDEIRLINLNLIKKESGLPWQDIAKRTGTAPAYLSQLRSKKTDRNIGHDLARRLESEFSKYHGWMDVLHTENEIIEITDITPERQVYRDLDDIKAQLKAINALLTAYLLEK